MLVLEIVFEIKKSIENKMSRRLRKIKVCNCSFLFKKAENLCLIIDKI